MSFPTPEQPASEDTLTGAAAHAGLDRTLSHRQSHEHPAGPVASRRMWLKRVFVFAGTLAGLLILALCISAIVLRHAMHAALPQLDGNLPVSGLTAPVTVTRDAQGVPSIHASNPDDLLFAQGYITASDRLFQMDALRRHGAGELAEILGPSLVDHDREQRILQLRAAADRAIAVLPPDQLHQLDTYARGVNAFIAAHPHTLPIEFHLLHYTPAPWSPRDSLLIALVMSQELSTEFPSKLNREAFSAHLPAMLLNDLYPIGSWRDRPPTQTPTDLTNPEAPIEQIPLDRTQSSISPQPECPGSGPLAPGLHDACSQPKTPAVPAADGGRVPHLRDGLIVATVGWKLPESPKANSPHADAGLATPQDLLGTYADLRTHLCDGCKSGSNNWVVAGSHTASGAPLLSNDMHLGLTAPGIWYEAALHVTPATDAASTSAVRAGPGLNVEGFTLPGVPFVIVGRNSFVSWGFTNSGADVQDILVEHLRGSGADTEYERPDHTWVPVGHQLEHIHVRAGRDVTLDVLTTTHTIGNTTSAGGITSIVTPIVSPLYKTEHRALALEWTVYDPSTITSPMYAIDTATDGASLVAAFAGFGSVSQNLVYADAHHIGYHLLGRIPIRGLPLQHPRATQQFILPDDTPSDDEQDESGDPDARLIPPQPNSVVSTEASRLHAMRSGERGPQRAFFARWGAETPVSALTRATQTPPQPQLTLASFSPSPHPNLFLLSALQRRRHRVVRRLALPVPTSAPTSPPDTQLPTAPTTAYTIGSPISPLPIDALDPSQAWSGYIPYDALPSVLDPSSGIIATANARIVTDTYPYFIANDWVDAYRVERIDHLLTSDIAGRNGLTPSDMLAIQTDVHSEFDLLMAQRLAYALDHSSLSKKDPRLQQAANLLRDWNGNLTAGSPAATIVASTRAALWPMLLAPQIRAHDHVRMSNLQLGDIMALYTWEEKTSALEQILQHTPARWLPHAFANWNDLLTSAVERGFHVDNAPGNLSTWTYGKLHPVEIPHPVFGSHSPISTLLGVATGSGYHPNGGDYTTIKAAGLHFGPSERFTADLSNPDDTHANITTGESGNPSSPWFLDQFLPWLNGTTFTLPLDNPTVTHTLTLTPK